MVIKSIVETILVLFSFISGTSLIPYYWSSYPNSTYISAILIFASVLYYAKTKRASC